MSWENAKNLSIDESGNISYTTTCGPLAHLKRAYEEFNAWGFYDAMDWLWIEVSRDEEYLDEGYARDADQRFMGLAAEDWFLFRAGALLDAEFFDGDRYETQGRDSKKDWEKLTADYVAGETEERKLAMLRLKQAIEANDPKEAKRIVAEYFQEDED